MSFFKECIEDKIGSYIDNLSKITEEEYKDYKRTNQVNFSLPLNSSSDYVEGYKEGYFIGYQKALEDTKKY